ncbi:DUF2057 family protein [Vibrio atypicus]|jgi:uncharacterized protein YccT (UPF0319 family)|uniref:DUF2057 family protein n=1 Tax=Vibrio atypicus TaxID=558271 RepID=UPI003736CE46
MIKKSLAVVLMALMSSLANAQVTIQTDKRVEILAVNQNINQLPNRGKGDLKIANGENQLLLRVTALVDGNGGKSKFNSLPMVVKFSANDETLKFETPFAIRDERGVRNFEKQPSVKVTRNGQAVDVTTDVIFDQTFALIKDYDEMLAGYNQAGGKAAIQTHAVNMKAAVAKPSTPKVSTAEFASTSTLQTDFLSMSPQQRQEFISWAVKHIND